MKLNRLVNIKTVQVALNCGYTKAHRIVKSINDDTVKNNKDLVINVGYAPANKIARKCPQIIAEELIQIQTIIDCGLVEMPQREISTKEASIINSKILEVIKKEPSIIN